jgi:branched-chain amino acid transport system ATP-binding protein
VSAQDATLHIEGISASRAGRPVLHDVTLEVPPDRITTLLGANGAGKSTLMLAVAGLVPTSAGRIRLGSRELTGMRPERVRRSGVAVVAEGRRLLGTLSVRENLRAATYVLDRSEAKSALAQALRIFPELDKRMDVPARLLSGGEQQMLVLAQALISRPTTLLVDEMSLGLAPAIVKRLLPVLARIATEGVGVLLVEQFAHLALDIADAAYVMDGGRIRYDGTAAQLRDRPELLEAAYRLNDHAVATN